jgi:hypothetical protein
MKRKPQSFPEAIAANVIKKLVAASKKCSSSEEFMVKTIKAIDKNDSGCATYEEVAQGCLE